MKGKKSPVRTYRFTLDVVCKQFLLNDFQFCVPARTLRAAWRLAKDTSVISDYLAYLGFPDINVQKVHLVSCDILALSVDCGLRVVKSVNFVR